MELHNKADRRMSKAKPKKIASTDKNLITDSGHMRLRVTRQGLMLFNRNDVYMGQCLDRYGEVSTEEVAALLNFVRPGFTVLDVGANIGTHTIPLAKAVGPTGMVISFEPQRFVFTTLCANVALNALGNVRPLWSGAGQQAGTAYVPPQAYDHAGNFGGVSLNAESGEAVPIITIDSLDLPACHLIKVDVEGMESAVLRGAEQTIARHRPVLYVENDRREHSAALISQIFAMGYRAYWHFPVLYGDNNFYATPVDAKTRIISVNLLCVPQDSPIQINGVAQVTSPDQRPSHWPAAEAEGART
jgi:FkbM family methyltransferase